MRVGIDASNLRGGGGVTHLAALLSHVDVAETGVERVVVWGPRSALWQLADRPWLVKSNPPELERSLASRIAWGRLTLPRCARDECDVLFAPGGLCTDRFHPVVTMSRNMLPFQLGEMWRYGFSRMSLRLAILRRAQRKSFQIADGVIFLTQFARDSVLQVTGPLRGQTTVIPHGIESRFFAKPRPQRAATDFTADNPMRLLYVSIVDVYKHQWNVAEAVARLRKAGLPIAIQFVGDAYAPAGRRLRRVLRTRDPQGQYLQYVGPLIHADLPSCYRAADGFVFASTCENLPNIVLEAMASGLPIACSNRLPMPEILGPAGVYFDPLSTSQIGEALRQLFHEAELRRRLAVAAYEHSQQFSWSVCARDTFRFLAEIGVWTRLDEDALVGAGSPVRRAG
ncbi:MAG TPA: glycosyltransferase family 1 protein [Planctomycetaceae bacterium]|nr:glycosyltransferase family 1 protein [Planctomycetaceae bacterium]